jgi:hypothetical protein
VAIVAAVGVLFVLVTPAPDELPSTGPHSLNKIFISFSSNFSLLPPEIVSGPQMPLVIFTPMLHSDLLALTCVRLC